MLLKYYTSPIKKGKFLKTSPWQEKYKIIWIGDSGVGKTCLLIKAQKHLFEHENKSTLGFEYYNITINLSFNILIYKLILEEEIKFEDLKILIPFYILLCFL